MDLRVKTSGCSGTPLAKKLGVGEGAKVVALESRGRKSR
jgi:hypothetical protein